MDNFGTLNILGTPIGNMADISERAIKVLNDVDVIMCEDTRETKKLLALLDIAFKNKRLISVREQNEKSVCGDLVDILNSGQDVVYVSDAGMPTISDPGARLVDAVHEANLKVVVIPGPSALTCAMALAGFIGNAFYFGGFFPRKESQQIVELRKLQNADQVSVYFESPNRLLDTLKFFEENLGEDRKVAVCREMTKKFEETVRGTIFEVIQHFSKGVKGECVIVIDVAEDNSTNVEVGEIEKAITLMIEKGLSSKDVIELGLLISPLSKNELKETYNRLKR